VRHVPSCEYMRYAAAVQTLMELRAGSHLKPTSVNVCRRKKLKCDWWRRVFMSGKSLASHLKASHRCPSSSRYQPPKEPARRVHQGAEASNVLNQISGLKRRAPGDADCGAPKRQLVSGMLLSGPDISGKCSCVCGRDFGSANAKKQPLSSKQCHRRLFGQAGLAGAAPK
jgi:hypothetical protein